MTLNEDRNQDTAIALITRDVDYIKKEIVNISTAVSKIADKDYVTRAEITAIGKDAEKQHIKINDEIQTIRLSLEVFKTQVKTWGAAAILALGILQFTISVFLK